MTDLSRDEVLQRALAYIESTAKYLPHTFDISGLELVEAIGSELARAPLVAENAALERMKVGEPVVWYEGEPPFPQNQKWFIARTIHKERVVLRALTKEHTYDYTTADGTYMLAKNITRWMQFPDSEYLTPASQQPGEPVKQEPVAFETPCGYPVVWTAADEARLDKALADQHGKRASSSPQPGEVKVVQMMLGTLTELRKNPALKYEHTYVDAAIAAGQQFVKEQSC